MPPQKEPLRNKFGATFFIPFKKLKSFLWPRGLASWIIIILVLILLWQVWSSWNFPIVDGNKWQAVFLSNNQVFFGHLKEVNSGYTLLEEVYYLRPAQGPQGKVDLVKLGEELHGPEPNMYIPKGQITFWENLKPDSQVVQVINQLKSQ